MRYQIQWFPQNTKYNADMLFKATEDQPEARNVKLVPYLNRYNPKLPVDHPTAVEFTVDGGYPTAQAVLFGINKYLMKKSRISTPQNISIRAVNTEERKRRMRPVKIKRKCRCKK